MNKVLAALAATSCLALAVAGVGAAQIAFGNEPAAPSPTIHGSADQTIMPSPSPAQPQRTPGALPGYPIERWNKLQEAGK